MKNGVRVLVQFKVWRLAFESLAAGRARRYSDDASCSQGACGGLNFPETTLIGRLENEVECELRGGSGGLGGAFGQFVSEFFCTAFERFEPVCGIGLFIGAAVHRAVFGLCLDHLIDQAC